MTDTHLPVAQFGNHDGSHSLLGYAGVDRAAFDRILMFTDRPPDLNMDEFTRVCAGYATTDGYAIQLTQPDQGAQRAGMVKTTAALIPFGCLAQVSVTRLSKRLGELDGPRTLRLHEVQVQDQASDAWGTGALADALLAKGKLVWTGTGFECALERAWESLSVEDQRRLTFGAAAHPDAVSVPCQAGGLVMLRTAERYAPRWDWPRIDATTPGPCTAAARAFLDANDPAHGLAAVLLDGPPRLEQWRHLTEAQQRLDRLDDMRHEGLRALAQLVCLLAPEPACGQEIKQRVALRLRRETTAASFADLRGLRTVDWHALTGGEPVDSLLHEWAASVWQDARRAADLASALAEVENSSDEFLGRLGTELRAAAMSARERLAAQAVAALDHKEGIAVLRWLAGAFGPRALDRALADAVPERAPVWLERLARDERLPATHAASVDIGDPVGAWRAQLTLPTSAPAAERLVGRLPTAGTVEAALALNDEKLTERAGALIAADAQLLPRDAPHNEVGRSVWAAAVRAGADPWTVVDPADARDALLSDLIDGVRIDPVLLRALADSSAANVFTQPRRTELWPRLPGELRQSFVSATAPTAAAEIADGGALPEAELQSAVLSTGVLGQLARKDLPQALTVLERLHIAGANDALMVMRAARFDRVTAERFGNLVVRRHWKRVAEALVDAEAARPDLRVAADRAQALLGLRDRIKRAVGLGSSVQTVATAEELRAALLEVAAELYPRGPTQRSVWERAGGKESDVPENESGRERWRSALAAVDDGARGAPRLPALLEAMIQDFPHNTELAPLAQGLRGDAR